MELTIATWWDSVYPDAVKLEKNITTAPTDRSKEDISSVLRTLPGVLKNIQRQPYPQDAASMRENLIRATTYLIHAYQELKNENDDEAEFYYSSALTQVSQLHYHLVQHGFAN